MSGTRTTLHSNLRSFEHFTGTRIVVVEGKGNSPDNPVREVTYWFDENGDLIERSDPAHKADCPPINRDGA